MKRFRAVLALACIVAGLSGYALAAISPAQTVMVVPIDGTVDDGMAHLVERAVTQANDTHASAVVLDVNSLGGLVEAALRIKDAIYAAHEPVYAYVSHRAYSSAALISLTTSRIIMAPGASIGSAEPHPDTRETVSALSTEFKSSVLRSRHDPKLAMLAASMVDRSISEPQYKAEGQFLTLDTADAVKSGIASGTADTLDQAISSFGFSGATQVAADYTWGEQIARFATAPQISGLLLSLGMLGLILEMQTLHGIAGTIGVVAFALFFGTHIYAGFSNGWVLALAFAGVFGILWELHIVPGHGVPGLLGLLALVAAVILSFGVPYFFVGVETLATSLVVTVIAFVFFARLFPENAWMHRFVLRAEQGPDYVASRDHSALLGAVGEAASYLRPAGVAQINGKRVDVLTEGEFIAAGTPVRVTRVEGARIFVEPVILPSYR